MEYVFKNKSLCCGCGACVSVCPKKAISMQEDKYGFSHPVINHKLCIDCKLCEKMCAYGKGKNSSVIKSYAAQNKNINQIKKSASGGIFAAVAEAFIKNGGAVVGSEMRFTDGVPEIEHIIIESEKDLTRLQGSKYVQSNTEKIFRPVYDMLESGRKVLFSGTPCQVAAIKKFCNKFSDNLYTIDLICHGVPGQKMFQDYIRYYSESKNTIVRDFRFRDKSYGWSTEGNITSDKGNEKVFKFNSSYYYYFLKGDIYRKSCYNCKYACDKRTGDITIGDYWGIEHYNPELLKRNGGILDESKGISCILENTQKGKFLLQLISECTDIFPVPLDNIKIVNTQLNHPTIPTNKRAEIMKAYSNGGYIEVENIFKSEITKIKIESAVKKCIPKSLKRKIKSFLKR